MWEYFFMHIGKLKSLLEAIENSPKDIPDEIIEKIFDNYYVKVGKKLP